MRAQVVEFLSDLKEVQVLRKQESRTVHAKSCLSMQKSKLNAQVVELVDTLS